MLALTLIQRCQPSVVSSARAACSMRSRSALRRASRSVVGERLAVEAAGHRGLPSGLGARPAGGPIPRRPHARQGVPPSGGESARQRAAPAYAASSSVVVGLVADRLVVLDGLALGALLLARGGLGLVVGGVGALDGLLEPGQRRGDVRPGELLERLRGDVLVRAPAGRGHPLAGRDDQARRVLLGGDDDQRAAVELAGALGAVDELPQPGERGLRVAVLAVVVAQPSAAAVLARLGDVAAQLLDDEPDAAGGDPGDPLPGLRVRGAVVVGAQQRVDELCRRGDYADTIVGRPAWNRREQVLEARRSAFRHNYPRLSK